MVQTQAACINLGPRETHKRRLMGLLFFYLGLALSLIFIWQDVNDWLRATVFAPYFLGYLGIFQALYKTCVVHALSGTQNLDAGNQPVDESANSRKLKSRSIWILVWSLFFAGLCTYLTLAIRMENMIWPQAPALPGG
ncbi:MAG: hypothetical protein JNJ77_07800 [Planctomycetia bacterium]|nr:hypothetical protein [Planctomycetia bacterium]